MVDLSRPWPLGLGEKRWWVTIAAALVLLGVVLAFDRQLSLAAQALPQALRDLLAELTPYGESGWILIPAGVLFALTALIALLVRWKLMRTMLWQFASLYAFILLGVGLPSLLTTLVKRIGRGRPAHFNDGGVLGFHPNTFDWTYQSFPSGHATTAFALAAVIGFASKRWFYPMLVAAGLIALSRLTLGVHYPTDVLAGAMIGLMGAYAVRLVFAGRGWMFDHLPDGRIVVRSMSSLKRYLALKRRGNAAKPLPDRP